MPGHSEEYQQTQCASATGDTAAPEPSLLDLARQAQAMRAKIAPLFPRDVFRDSAWDMVLALFVAGQENRPVFVKELIIASGETSTSALRRIDRLENAGLIRRTDDPLDNRRLIVTLTAKGDEAMRAMLRSLFLEARKGHERKGAAGSAEPHVSAGGAS